MKNNKGITLIALVITIIVLLILAGVSIAMLTGENGILTQAGNAKTQTNRAEALERVNMELNGQLANAMAGTAFDTAATINANLTNMPKGYEAEATLTPGTAGEGKYGTDAKVKIVLTSTNGDTFSEGTVSYDSAAKVWKITPVKDTTPTT